MGICFLLSSHSISDNRHKDIGEKAWCPWRKVHPVLSLVRAEAEASAVITVAAVGMPVDIGSVVMARCP